MSFPSLFSITLYELTDEGKRTGRELNAVLSRNELKDPDVMDAVTGSMFECVNTPGVVTNKMTLFGKDEHHLMGLLNDVPWYRASKTITINEVGDDT